MKPPSYFDQSIRMIGGIDPPNLEPGFPILKYRFQLIFHADNGFLECAGAIVFDYRVNGDKDLLKVD